MATALNLSVPAAVGRAARENGRRRPSAPVHQAVRSTHSPRSQSLILKAKKGFDLGKELLDVMEGGPKLRKW